MLARFLYYRICHVIIPAASLSTSLHVRGMSRLACSPMAYSQDLEKSRSEGISFLKPPLCRLSNKRCRLRRVWKTRDIPSCTKIRRTRLSVSRLQRTRDQDQSISISKFLGYFITLHDGCPFGNAESACLLRRARFSALRAQLAQCSSEEGYICD